MKEEEQKEKPKYRIVDGWLETFVLCVDRTLDNYSWQPFIYLLSKIEGIKPYRPTDEELKFGIEESMSTVIYLSSDSFIVNITFKEMRDIIKKNK